MITTSQRRVIDSIVSLFETGHLPSPAAYGTCTILADGAGITYGLHQTTAASSLPAVLEAYIAAGGVYAARIRQLAYLLPSTRALRPGVPIPPDVTLLCDLLRAAGADPVMQAAQNKVFDANYWVPASTYASSIGLAHALSHLVLYDTWIQSGGGRVAELRKAFAGLPPSRGGDEYGWTLAFTRARRAWLAGYASPDVQKQKLVRSTVYRCDSLLELIADDAWDLRTPLVVRGVTILEVSS